MGDPSAILAINSLDRYITTVVTRATRFVAFWTTGQNTITYSTGETPVLGNPAVPKDRTILITPGIPANTYITATAKGASILQGTWYIGNGFAYVYVGVPVLGASVTAYGMDAYIYDIQPFPSGNGYSISLSNDVDLASPNFDPGNGFLATWVIGNNFITKVAGTSTPAVGDSMTDGTDIFGIVTFVLGNRIEYNGITPASQFSPTSVLFETPSDISQQYITVSISQNTTTTADNQFVTQKYPITTGNQPVSNALIASYEDIKPYSYDFSISSPGALIYGYINRIIVSQLQLQYNIPTVSLGKNDTFSIGIGASNYSVTIPHGFYYADELASVMQGLIVANPSLAGLGMTVTFVPRDGFVFTSTTNQAFYFPDPAVSIVGNADYLYRAYRLLGMSIANAVPAVSQTSFDYPNFLYTPYIDIYSDVLTNYQNIKDTNTSIQKPKGLVARVYVSGTGQIQTTGSTSALGTAPFVMTSDLNTPKVIRWSPDVAVPSIDFQLLDQYGDFIPGAKEGFSTEFQMTLLCVEHEN